MAKDRTRWNAKRQLRLGTLLGKPVLTSSISTGTFRVNAHGMMTLNKPGRKSVSDNCASHTKERSRLQDGHSEDEPKLLIPDKMSATRITDSSLRIIAISENNKAPRRRNSEPIDRKSNTVRPSVSLKASREFEKYAQKR